MVKPTKSKTRIELFVPDLEKTIRWYKKIGFKVWSHRPEQYYAILTLQGNMINFYGTREAINKHDFMGKFPADTPVGYCVEITLMVNSLNKIYGLALKNYRKNIEREMKPERWTGKRNFRLRDLWGFYLRFTEPLVWKR